MEEFLEFYKYLVWDVWLRLGEGGRKIGCLLGCGLGRVFGLDLVGEELLGFGI